MTIYDRFVLYMLSDVYWLARSKEVKKRYDRKGMRSYDIEAFRRYYSGVERLRPVTFNPWTDILIERYEKTRKILSMNDGLYEELGYPYNI